MNTTGSNHNKRILINISWLLLEHGVRLAAGVFSASILARVLGVEGYGMFNYILGITFIFQSISYINPAELMVPKLTNASTKERQVLVGNGFFIRLSFSIVAYLLLLLFIAITDGYFQFKIALILGATVLFSEAAGIVTAYLQSQTLIKYRSRLVMFTDITKALTLITIYKLGYTSIYLYAAIHVGQHILIAIGLLYIYYSLTTEIPLSFSRNSAYQLIRQGFPFFVGIVFMIIFLRLDIVFMRHYTDQVSLGLYASAIQLFQQAAIVAPILSSSCAPLLVYRYNEVSEVRKNVTVLSLVMFFIGSITALILYYFSPYLIALIFGEGFDGSVDIFRRLLIVLPLFFLNEGLNIYLLKMGLSRLLIYKWVLVLLGAIIAYKALIPEYGSIGAVVGYGIGYILACVFGLYSVFRFKEVAN